MDAITVWKAKIKEYEIRLKAGETLAPQELIDLDWLQQKLADLRSD